MRRRWIALSALGFWLTAATGTARAPKAGEIEVRPIKYNDLSEAIRRQKGKVVVVDF